MIEWEGIFRELESVKDSSDLPSVSLIGEENGSPFSILVSTVISLRTKDDVTLAASRRLLEKAGSPALLANMPEEEIARLIYPCGFYRVKSSNLKKIGEILCDRRAGSVPDTLQELLALPGVGLKTANLVLSLGFGIPAICVDTHVHRIANRMGWVRTAKPDDTVGALERVLPEKYWIPVNELLVLFGQKICQPVSPRCSECPLTTHCLKTGVTRSR